MYISAPNASRSVVLSASDRSYNLCDDVDLIDYSFASHQRLYTVQGGELDIIPHSQNIV